MNHGFVGSAADFDEGGAALRLTAARIKAVLVIVAIETS